MLIRKGWIKMLYLLVAVLLGSSLVFGQAAVPRITSVEPVSGHIGDELTASGENLDQTNVAELRLTDGANDFKAPIISQSVTAIKFKIPNEVKPGKYGLVTLSKMASQSIEIEQPVKVWVK